MKKKSTLTTVNVKQLWKAALKASNLPSDTVFAVLDETKPETIAYNSAMVKLQTILAEGSRSKRAFVLVR